MRRQPLYRPTQDSPFVGLAAAKNLDGIARLKPEPSIYHVTFDLLDSCDGDPSGSRRMAEIRARAWFSSQLSARRTITILTAMPVR